MSNNKSFINGLSGILKDQFFSILNNLEIEKQEIIKKEVNIDHKHLDIVNLCSTSFFPYTKLNLETGYQLILYEPLYEKNIKNYDIALYNTESKHIMLIECKSSMTYLKKASLEIKESIYTSIENKDELESIIGDEIKDIEFVYCVPSIDAIGLGNYVLENDLPICIWCYDGFKGIIKLYVHNNESTKEGIEKGHLHKNHKLTRILSKGTSSSPETPRSFSFLPSSHIYTILMDISVSMVRKMNKKDKWEGSFEFSDVYHIIKSNMAKPNTLTEKDMENKTVNVIEKGKIKEIFYDSTPNIDKFERKIWRMHNNGLRINRTEKFINNNFVELNAKKIADKEIIDVFKKKTGYKNITDFK